MLNEKPTRYEEVLLQCEEEERCFQAVEDPILKEMLLQQHYIRKEQFLKQAIAFDNMLASMFENISSLNAHVAKALNCFNEAHQQSLNKGRNYDK